jgi:glycerol-3-phosphate dehydrogenase
MDVTYIGTTDTSYEGDKTNPKVNKEDVEYLLKAVNRMFTDINLEIKHVISSWVGLRPLIDEEGKSPSELSRADELFQSDSGLITIAGGKLTGYRLMAKKVVRLICDRLHITRKCKTRRIKLCGGEFRRTKEVINYKVKIGKKLLAMGLDKEKAFYLVHLYGKQTEKILEILIDNSFKHLIEAEAFWAIHFEGAMTLIDFFARRTGKTLFEPMNIIDEMDCVIKVFQTQLNWNGSKIDFEQKMIFDKLKELRTF